MSSKKEMSIHNYLQELLASDPKPEEELILQKALVSLEKGAYLPKLIASLESELTPLAVKSQLSPQVGAFYLKITSHAFKDKELGRGIISLGFLHP